jgi:hypothetical protein
VAGSQKPEISASASFRHHSSRFNTDREKNLPDLQDFFSRRQNSIFHASSNPSISRLPGLEDKKKNRIGRNLES